MLSKDAPTKIPVYMADFHYFCKECLGYTDMNEEHLKLCRFLQFDEHRFKMVLMPRYSFKSCVATIGYALWLLVRNPNERILIYSDAATKAKGFLLGIKNHIEGMSETSKFSKYFVNWMTDRLIGKWNDSQIVIRPRTGTFVEPSVDTAGIDTSRVGMHYDTIIYDDIVTDQNVTTKELMDKTYECYTKSLSLLKPNGRVLMVGTRWSQGDAYGRLIEEDKGEWGFFIRQARTDEGKYPFESIGLSEPFITDQLKRQGSYIWSCIYQNQPCDPTTAIFLEKDFNFYGDLFNTDNLYITCTVDPAGEGDDYTGITVVGTDSNMRMYVLDAINRAMKPAGIINEIVRLSYAWKFRILGIETNTFNGMLERDLQLALEVERSNPKFVPFSLELFRATCKKGEGKHARILSLQPFHERGDLLFPKKGLHELGGGFKDLSGQMLQYTHAHRPRYDDVLDSLAYHTQLIRRGYGEKEEQLPEMCIANVIEESRVRFNESQRRIPRMFRKYQPSFYE